jgi:hypothetical protein
LTNPSKYGIIIKMRKLSLGVVLYATVSVVLILGACMKPVGIMDLLNDDRVQDIIDRGKTGGKIEIEIENPDDLKPELNNGVLSEGDTVTVSAGPPVSINITVTNASIFNDGIEWDFNGDDLTASGVLNAGKTELTITDGEAPFNVKGMYQLTVVGVVSGVPYSTRIFIEVID